MLLLCFVRQTQYQISIPWNGASCENQHLLCSINSDHIILDQNIFNLVPTFLWLERMKASRKLVFYMGPTRSVLYSHYFHGRLGLIDTRMCCLDVGSDAAMPHNSYNWFCHCMSQCQLMSADMRPVCWYPRILPVIATDTPPIFQLLKTSFDSILKQWQFNCISVIHNKDIK